MQIERLHSVPPSPEQYEPWLQGEQFGIFIDDIARPFEKIKSSLLIRGSDLTRQQQRFAQTVLTEGAGICHYWLEQRALQLPDAQQPGGDYLALVVDQIGRTAQHFSQADCPELSDQLAYLARIHPVSTGDSLYHVIYGADTVLTMMGMIVATNEAIPVGTEAGESMVAMQEARKALPF